MKISVSGIADEIKRIRKGFKDREASNLALQTHKFVEAVAQATPIDTGEARKGWVAVKTREGFEVKNEVEHIEFLNKGSSKQAPAHFVELTALQYGTPQGAIVESIK